MKAIHLVYDILQKEVVRSVLKHYHVKESVRVCKPGGKPFWRDDDTLVVWHGRDTASIVLFDYLSKVIPGSLFEVDYSHADKFAEKGYSLVAIGDEAIIKARCGKTISLVSEEKRREAASNWDRLSERLLPLYLMGEDGVIRGYPKDYLKDWLLGMTRIFSQDNERIRIDHMIGFAMGSMYLPNVNAIPYRYFEHVLSKLATSGKIAIVDGKYVLNNDYLRRADISWFNEGNNSWECYRRWKDAKSLQPIRSKKNQ